MKPKSRVGRRSVQNHLMVESLESRQLLSGTPATGYFADSFTPAASALWDNSTGNWTSSSGAYYAQNPINTPFATSELPYKMGDFTATFTANNLTDGGVWIHNDGTNQNGIVLILGGEGYGQGDRGGKAGTSIYWQVVVGGSGYVGGVLDETLDAFTTGDNYNITVTAVGDTYSAYINGSTTPATTLTTSQFPTGQFGFYDDQPNVSAGGSGAPMTFSNLALNYTDLPAELTPTLKGKLPATAIGGQATPVKQTLTLTNTTGSIFNASATTQFFLDTGTNLDASAIAITSPVAKTLKLKNNAHFTLPLALKSLPSTVPAGVYHVIAEVTDAGGSSVATSASTITVAAPVISLSSSLSPIVNIKSGDTLTISNAGNIADIGKLTQTVSFSTDAAGASPAGTAGTTVKPLHLNAHKSLKVHVGLTKTQLASLTSGDSYYLVITDSDSAGNSTSVISAVPFTAA
jgi:hypothetical protein